MKIEKILKIPKPELSLSDFVLDKPFPASKKPDEFPQHKNCIDGVRLVSLKASADSRGALTELITERDNFIDEIVHVYQVLAKADSRRAWIYHQHHTDRLAFTDGHFRIVLYDLRVNSPTFGILNILVGGIEQPALLFIPPYVIHGVHNMDTEDAFFISMPTKFWDPLHPDKLRLPEKDPRIPFNFDA